MFARSCPVGPSTLDLSPLLMLHLGPRNLRVAQLLKPEVYRLGLHSFYATPPVVTTVAKTAPYSISHPVLDGPGRGNKKSVRAFHAQKIRDFLSPPAPSKCSHVPAFCPLLRRGRACRCAEPFPPLTQPIPPSPSAHPATAERWQAEPSFRGPGLRQLLLSPPLRRADGPTHSPFLLAAEAGISRQKKRRRGLYPRTPTPQKKDKLKGQ